MRLKVLIGSIAISAFVMSIILFLRRMRHIRVIYKNTILDKGDLNTKLYAIGSNIVIKLPKDIYDWDGQIIISNYNNNTHTIDTSVHNVDVNIVEYNNTTTTYNNTVINFDGRVHVYENKYEMIADVNNYEIRLLFINGKVIVSGEVLTLPSLTFH